MAPGTNFYFFKEDFLKIIFSPRFQNNIYSQEELRKDIKHPPKNHHMASSRGNKRFLFLPYIVINIAYKYKYH